MIVVDLHVAGGAQGLPFSLSLLSLSCFLTVADDVLEAIAAARLSLRKLQLYAAGPHLTNKGTNSISCSQNTLMCMPWTVY